MPGKLSQNPAAELIREIAESQLTGALRLQRQRAKAVALFEAGQLLFASSNLRAHRLREILKRRGFTDAQLGDSSASTSDNELAAALLKSGAVTPETLAAIRSGQVCDVLRAALLWTEGSWVFDPRARLANEARVRLDVNQILLECARHLPTDFVTARFPAVPGTYSPVANTQGCPALLPTEAFVLSRASGGVSLNELTALSGLSEAEALRTIYALSLAGQLQRSDWPSALSAEAARVAKTPGQRAEDRVPGPEPPTTPGPAGAEPEDVDALFARLAAAKDYYEVLNVGRSATGDEVKSAYHALARLFHPDRFHQREAALRRNIESAFARIAQAYETLSNQSLRDGYDKKQPPKVRAPRRESAAPVRPSNGGGARPAAEANRAETSFKRGMEAMQSNRHEEAIRLLAEAAMLSPREARYRAHYGHALIKQTKTRRLAEGELQAALSIDPDNTSYRVMLAELYQELGLRRRAQGELERALLADPKNQTARQLLLSLKSK
jgi:curved DNA-binding protein CbpA